MPLKSFTGFSIGRDNSTPQRRFVGLSVSTIENLFIQVRDTSGYLLKCTIVVIQGGQVQGVYASNPLNLYVEASASLIIEARAVNHSNSSQIVSHGGEGYYKTVSFSLAKQFVLRTDIQG